MAYSRIERFVLMTAAEWAVSTQVLRTDEAGLEFDTGKVKQGNGLAVFSSLSYLAGFGAGGGSMVYPGAGIALSTGAAWDTSITNNSADWNTAFGWGNHAGIYLAKSNNLSDLTFPQLGRQNLLPSFATNAGWFLKVNALEDDVEWALIPGGGDMLSSNNLSDVVDSQASRLNILPSIGGNAFYFLRVNGGETDYELGAPNLSEFNNDVGYISDASAFVPYTGAAADVDLGSFTLKTKGLSIFAGGVDAVLKIDADADILKQLRFSSGDLARWSFDVVDTEAGGGVGANLELRSYDDGGSFLSAIMVFNRVSSSVDFPSGDLSTAGSFSASNFSGTSSGTNTGDQTSIVGITGTRAEFDLACTDAEFLYAGDVTQYTNELAQDAVGAMIDTSLVYVDGTPLLTRAALTGAITASQGSNTTALGSFTKAQLDAAVSDGNVLYVGDVTQYTDELAQDAVGAMVDATIVYTDGTPLLSRAALTGAVTASAGSNTTALGSFTKAQLDTAVSDGNIIYVGDNATSATTAATATALLNARTIGGVSFDGTANIVPQTIQSINEATDTSCFLLFITASGSQSLQPMNNTALTFNSNTASLGATLMTATTSLTTASVLCSSNDGGAIGASGTGFSDLFLASGAVINFNAGNATLTHSAALITSNVNIAVPDEAYGTTWNGSLNVPTKNAIFDMMISTSGVAQNPTASGTQNITHNLGRTPTRIRIYGMADFTSNAAATPVPFSIGTWNSTGNRCVYMTSNGTTTQASQTSTTFAVFLATSAGNTISGVIGNVGATQFDIVWTETGTALAKNFLWEAE